MRIINLCVARRNHNDQVNIGTSLTGEVPNGTVSCWTFDIICDIAGEAQIRNLDQGHERITSQGRY